MDMDARFHHQAPGQVINPNQGYMPSPMKPPAQAAVAHSTQGPMAHNGSTHGGAVSQGHKQNSPAVAAFKPHEPVLDVQHPKPGVTITTLQSGTKVEQVAGQSPYVVNRINPTQGYMPSSDKSPATPPVSRSTQGYMPSPMTHTKIPVHPAAPSAATSTGPRDLHFDSLTPQSATAEPKTGALPSPVSDLMAPRATSPEVPHPHPSGISNMNPSLPAPHHPVTGPVAMPIGGHAKPPVMINSGHEVAPKIAPPVAPGGGVFGTHSWSGPPPTVTVIQPALAPVHHVNSAPTAQALHTTGNALGNGMGLIR